MSCLVVRFLFLSQFFPWLVCCRNLSVLVCLFLCDYFGWIILTIYIFFYSLDSMETTLARDNSGERLFRHTCIRNVWRLQFVINLQGSPGLPESPDISGKFLLFGVATKGGGVCLEEITFNAIILTIPLITFGTLIPPIHHSIFLFSLYWFLYLRSTQSQCQTFLVPNGLVTRNKFWHYKMTVNYNEIVFLKQNI